MRNGRASRVVSVAALAAAILCASPAPKAAVGQDWRATGLASFDIAWQTIQETFYDPTFGGVDWAAVRTELRPRVEAAASPDVVRTIIRDMLTRLNRSHFALLSAMTADALPGPATPPFEFRLHDGDVVITRISDARVRQIAAGQSLVSIEGRPVADIIKVAQGPDERTRMFDAWRLVNQVLHGADGSPVKLGIRAPGGQAREVSVERTLGAGETVSLGNLPPLRVAVEVRERRTPAGRRAGVIWFSVWMIAVNEPFARAIDTYRKHDGLVIDLRGNPGGLAGMMRGIAGHLISEPVDLGTMQTRHTRLTFPVNPRVVTDDGRQVQPFAGPVAILVDELTGSASETFAGSLQSLRRARVFGRTTMGQAMPAVTKQLPNGDVLLYAIGNYITSTGRSLEGPGVVPDVEIPLSPKALAAGRDPVLDAALAWFDSVARK